jgi:type IV pilus assembly protein PilV
LVEVLVTMVVITIGLLGVAGLQMGAFNSSYGTLQRQVASMQVQDAVERLWGSACALAKKPVSTTTESSVRSAVTNEWNTEHSSTGTDRVALPSRSGTVTWRGAVDDKGTSGNTSDDTITLVYEVSVTWTNDKIDKNGSSSQSVSQVAQIPTLTCPSS